MKDNVITLIIDGQWGSTGKGLLAGYLATKNVPDACVCNFGPNAGHTVQFECGKSIMVQQFPTGIITSPNIFIGPGAVMDLDILEREALEFAPFLKNKNIYLHERMAVVIPGDKEQEKAQVNYISSTCKGTGAAACRKIMRQTGGILKNYTGTIALINEKAGIKIQVVDNDEYLLNLVTCNSIQVESAQGLGLSLNVGNVYPNCTSRDITPGQILCDCGIPLHWLSKYFLQTFVSMRTFPIRVGNVYDGEGRKIGDSGPVYSDQKEISFNSLNVDEERTTVTKKVRRIFTFSLLQLKQVRKLIGPNAAIFMNFVNYLEGGFNGGEFAALLRDIKSTGMKVAYASDGPYISSVRHLGTGGVWSRMESMPYSKMGAMVSIQRGLSELDEHAPTIDFMLGKPDEWVKTFLARINALTFMKEIVHTENNLAEALSEAKSLVIERYLSSDDDEAELAPDDDEAELAPDDDEAESALNGSDA